MVKIENCGGDGQVLKVDPNATVTLDKECNIVITGCGETTGFKTAKVSSVINHIIWCEWTVICLLLFFCDWKVTYTILKNGNRITSGTTDVCAELAKDSKGIATALMSFGLPKSCPVEQVKLPFTIRLSLSRIFSNWHYDSNEFQLRQCADGTQKINIAKHKALLPLAVGNIDISIDGTHDTVS